MENMDKNLKMKVLDEVYRSLLDVLDDYAMRHHMSDSQKEEIRQIFNQAYLEEKMALFLEEKTDVYAEFLNYSAQMALNASEGKQDRPYMNITYVKQFKELMTIDG